MFRRKKKKEAKETAAAPEETAEAPAEAVPVPDATETTEMPVEEPVAEAPPPEVAEEAPPVSEPPVSEPAPAPQPAMAGNGSGGNGVRHSPREAARVSLDDFVGNPRTSEEQRQQAAAAELMEAIAPAQHMLMEEVPDASSPDDAVHRLLERQNERPVLPDPEGERLRTSDIYRTDASVYYRLQKRFTWKPQAGPYKTRWAATTLSGGSEKDTTRARLPRGRGR